MAQANRFKFRLWDVESKSMMIDNDYFIDFYSRIWYDSGFSCIELIEQYNVIIMQCTGLQDHNGKDIYEGDLIYWSALVEPDSSVVVEWHQDSCGFFLTRKEGENTAVFGLSKDATLDDMEVIGNIHENPELLNG